MHHSLIIFLGLIVLTGFGCGQTVTEKLTENAINQQLDGQGSVNLDNNQITFTDDENQTTFSMGEDIKLPTNFPAALPVYEPGELRSVSVNTGEDQNAYVLIYTQDDQVKVMAWYQERLIATGWTASGNFNLQGTSTTLWEKADQNITVSTTAAEEKPFKTAITAVLAE